MVRRTSSAIPSTSDKKKSQRWHCPPSETMGRGECCAAGGRRSLKKKSLPSLPTFQNRVSGPVPSRLLFEIHLGQSCRTYQNKTLQVEWRRNLFPGGRFNSEEKECARPAAPPPPKNMQKCYSGDFDCFSPFAKGISTVWKHGRSNRAGGGSAFLIRFERAAYPCFVCNAWLGGLFEWGPN